MTAAHQHSAPSEHGLLATLRDQYEAKGFTFEVAPDRAATPEFLGTYLPDAIARKANENVAIEVRQRRSRATDLTLQQIRARFEGHPDWTFVVAYIADDPSRVLSLPAASKAEILRKLDAVRKLEAEAHHEAAFIMGWSLLEATLLNIEDDPHARPRMPGSVVQSLAMLGYLKPQLEEKLRPLIMLRNRVVHGDLRAAPTPDQVSVVLSAVEEALADE
ncbi:hypothetical protein ACWGK7_17985 (plasmid) [Sphingomonas aurantiaca]